MKGGVRPWCPQNRVSTNESRSTTLGLACNEQMDAKKTAGCRRLLVVTELFNIAVNDFDTKKFTHWKWVLVVTELVINRAQCTSNYK